MQTTQDELRELERRWIQGELEADTAALDAVATDDFKLVGPAGFVLGKQQWLERYGHGDLHTHSLRLDDAITRIYPTAAVIVGRRVQQADYRGRPANGEFRATHIAIRDGSQWRLAGIHLSPIGGAPPFPAPHPDKEDPR